MNADNVDIRDFFLSPRPPKRLPKRLQESGKRSLLHLLRRDLCKLYGPERHMGESDRYRQKPPLLSVLGMFVGIDMMSTFSCPENIRKNPGPRFKWFAKNFSTHPVQDEWQIDFLWSLRNAVAHQYSMRVEAGNFYRFSTDLSQENWVEKNGQIYVINLWGFKDLFRQMIRLFGNAVSETNNSDLRERFLKRYRESGSMTAPPLLRASHEDLKESRSVNE